MLSSDIIALCVQCSFALRLGFLDSTSTHSGEIIKKIWHFSPNHWIYRSSTQFSCHSCRTLLMKDGIWTFSIRTVHDPGSCYPSNRKRLATELLDINQILKIISATNKGKINPWRNSQEIPLDEGEKLR